SLMSSPAMNRMFGRSAARAAAGNPAAKYATASAITGVNRAASVGNQSTWGHRLIVCVSGGGGAARAGGNCGKRPSIFHDLRVAGRHASALINIFKEKIAITITVGTMGRR